MIRLKTSCLISASVRIGAILAGVDEATEDLLEKIGEHAVLAFRSRMITWEFGETQPAPGNLT
jgi:geranylgeranyl pyrophosphate synthase